jgi:hypothetical protein
MDIEEIRAMINDDYGHDICLACGSAEMFAHYEIAAPLVTMIDVFNIRWCAEHQFRGEFANLMSRWGWPAIEVYTEELPQRPDYSLDSGMHATFQAVLTYSDDVIVFMGLQALKDHQESEQVA